MNYINNSYTSSDSNDLLMFNDLSIDRENNRHKVLKIPNSTWTVDNRGVVRNARGKVCTPDVQWDGSHRVLVPYKNSRRWTYINNLVLSLFMDRAPTDKHVPWHRDGDRNNNRVDNLSWVVLGSS